MDKFSNEQLYEYFSAEYEESWSRSSSNPHIFNIMNSDLLVKVFVIF